MLVVLVVLVDISSRVVTYFDGSMRSDWDVVFNRECLRFGLSFCLSRTQWQLGFEFEISSNDAGKSRFERVLRPNFQTWSWTNFTIWLLTLMHISALSQSIDPARSRVIIDEILQLHDRFQTRTAAPMCRCARWYVSVWYVRLNFINFNISSQRSRKSIGKKSRKWV